MITTVTLNPCLDRTLEISNFIYGGTHRVSSVRTDACGKGINVSIALHQLGWNTLCTGFSYYEDKAQEETLEGKSIPYDFVNVPGKTRTNIKVFDSASQVMTEFNEAGGEVTKEDVEKLVEKVKEHISETELLVISGSVPPGVPADTYYRLVQIGNEAGKKVILDASGKLLAEGIKAKPFLIKPNKLELEQVHGGKIESINDAISASRTIIRSGVAYVCVSLGKDGALLVTGEKVYFSEGADIQVKGVQGAGDSLVTGMSIAILKGITEPEILHYGMAVAHGSLIHEGTQMCTKEDFAVMMNIIKVREI